MNHPIIDIVNLYLNKSGYDIDREEVGLQISSHQDFPHLIAISDLFHHFGIAHYALKLERKKEIVDKLPVYFLAHCIIDNKPILVLVQKRANSLRIIRAKNEKNSISLSEFLRVWTGVLISFKEIPNTLKSRDVKKKLFLKIVLSMSAIFLGLFLFYSKVSVIGITWLGLSLLGLTTGILIIQHEMGINLKTINKLCRSFENSSCDAIITSNGASFFGIIKLSDLIIAYFTAHVLYALISMSSSLVLIETLFLCSLLTIPFVLYSLFYQGVVAKRWCPLCLATAGVLITQLTVTFYNMDFQALMMNFQKLSLVTFLFLIFLSVSGWLFLSPFLHRSVDLKKIKLEHFRFKRNFDFFQHALKKMPEVSKYNRAAKDIVLGNHDANLIITLVTNPLCFYCAESHQVLDNLLTSYGDRFKLNILFNIPNPSETNRTALIAHYFIKIYNEKGADVCKELMNDFYRQKDKVKWLSKKDQNLNNDYFDLLSMHHNWCKKHAINFTPALVINDQLYPKKYYKINELPFFMEDLISRNLINEELQPSIRI
ncbi:vitamin K epoxide reductase family protein [Flavobacteriaceae bacterium M23B6Z8]